MKKLSVIFTFLLLATLTKAQQTISPATNQVWWGYFSENDFGYKDAMLSRGRVRPLMACIRIPANNQLLKSATIKAVRIYLSAKTVEPLSDMKIWISRSLPDKVSDADATKLSFDLSRQIQNEMTYPGQIKVTVIRETRAVNYAK